MKRLLILLMSLVLLCSCSPIKDEESSNTESDTCTNAWDEPTTKKPVIYLYPEKETAVFVKLHYNGTLTFTYPAYNDGWNVTAKPDGTILSDGNEYSYLFWEGEGNAEYDMSRGFVVKGEDTAVFLQDVLSRMGLTAREYNEFIVYWAPQMQNNPYNLITFQGEAYTENAVLEITPTPDSILRVFMVYQALEAPIETEEPEIVPFERNGFTVIEWGGSELLSASDFLE